MFELGLSAGCRPDEALPVRGNGSWRECGPGRGVPRHDRTRRSIEVQVRAKRAVRGIRPCRPRGVRLGRRRDEHGCREVQRRENRHHALEWRVEGGRSDVSRRRGRHAVRRILINDGLVWRRVE